MIDDVPKKLCKTVAHTIRKMQLPNHAEAVRIVSGSPDENLLYVRNAPISPVTAAAA